MTPRRDGRFWEARIKEPEERSAKDRDQTIVRIVRHNNIRNTRYFGSTNIPSKTTACTKDVDCWQEQRRPEGQGNHE